MQGKDNYEFELRQIIRALTWWLEGGYKTSNAVGAIIQQKAQKLLDIKADMSALKTEAEDRLKKVKLEEAMNLHLKDQLNQSLFSMRPGKVEVATASFPWMSYPFPVVTIKKKTRREELEGYDNGQIRTIFNEAQAKEIKKDRINYILESEKEYK